MRFDTPIYFQRVKKGAYNANTGNYDAETVEEEQRLASKTDSGTQTMLLVYGKLKQGSLTVCIQNAYNKPFDYIRIGEKRYTVDTQRLLRIKQTFIISEV